MSDGTRSRTGCYTCRLRKKKCDEQKPICLNCRSRAIECYGYGARPAWMWGIDSWKEILETEEAREIREAAGRKYKARGPTGTRKKFVGRGKELGDGKSVVAGLSKEWISDVTDTEASSVCIASAGSAPGQANNAEYGFFSTNMELQASTITVPTTLGPIWWDNALPSTHLSLHKDMRLLLVFLDAIFPLQFGFYSLPRSSSKGLPSTRSWLIHTLHTTDSFYHALLTLSACFEAGLRANATGLPVAGTPGDLDPDTRALQTCAVGQLQRRVDELAGLSDDKKCSDEMFLSKAIQALVSISPLLSVEIFTFVGGRWEMHLDASGAILSMIQRRGIDIGAWLSDDGVDLQSQISSDEMAALRFYAGVYVWGDVIRNATFGMNSPSCGATRLIERTFDYVPLLQSGVVDTQRIMGCEGTVLALIAEISAVEATIRRGDTTPTDIAIQVSDIETALHAQIWSLKLRIADSTIPLAADSAKVTLLFAHAALIYLYTLTYTTHTHPLIVLQTARCLSLFESLAPKLMIRVCWPFTVAASMAPAETYAHWRGVLDRLGRERVPLGMVWQGLKVAEECWRMRACGEGEVTWREGLGSLGARIFLV